MIDVLVQILSRMMQQEASSKNPMQFAKSFSAFLRDLGNPNEYSRLHVRENQAVMERFLGTLKQAEIYHQEYESHCQPRDGMSGFTD